MPTAARLVAALAFGAIGYAIYISMVAVFADDTVPVYLLPLCVLTGVWAGWVVCGKHALGLRSGIGNGYTAIVSQAFIIIFVMSFVTMIERSLRRRYPGPVDALIDHFTLMFENTMTFATPEIGLILVVGGFVGGALAGLAGRKFPH